MANILEINELSAGYKLGTEIIHNINLVLNAGDIMGVIGRNGCGKSTLAKSIFGYVPITHGTIFYMGKPLPEQQPHQMQFLGISIMLQGGRVFHNLSIWDNIQMAYRNRNDIQTFNDIRDISPVLQDTPKNLSKKKADKLSGGERHQLALAMTLLSAHKLIILDEPTAGLMPAAAKDMYAIIKKIRNRFETSILLIEQNIIEAESFASQIAFMEHGEITYLGNDKEIINNLILN